MTTFLGLLRDFVVAVVAVLIIAGVEVSDELLAGILLLISTGAALTAWGWSSYQRMRA